MGEHRQGGKEERRPSSVVNEESGENPQQRRRQNRRWIAISVWSSLLVVGILMQITMLPLTPPKFGQLTAYECEGITTGVNISYGLGGRRGLRKKVRSYSCRAGERFFIQSSSWASAINSSAWQACNGRGGHVMVWQVPIPSPYQRTVFQTTCDGTMIQSYEDAAKAYTSSQGIARLIVWSLLLGSGTALLFSLRKAWRDESTRSGR